MRSAVYLAVFLLLTSVAFGGSLELYYPNTEFTGLSTTCNDGEWCSLDVASADQICDREGPYYYQYNAVADPTTNHDGTPLTQFAATERNWDNEQFCKGVSDDYTCINNRDVDWVPTRCCGARPQENCGEIVGGHVCGQMDPIAWQWKHEDDDRGNIYNYQCANASVVADGSDWYSCGDVGQLTSPMLLADLVNVSKDDDSAHGYACGELYPTQIDGYKRFVECVGNRTRQSQTVADSVGTGYRVSPNLIFEKVVTGSDEVQAQYNVDATKGKVVMKITPTWDVTDPNERVFISIDDNPDTSFIRIRKQSSSPALDCIYYNGGDANTVTLAPNFASGETFTLTMEWEAGVSLSCSIAEDGQSDTTGAPAAITPQTIHIGKHAYGGGDAASAIDLKIYDSHDPYAFYCTSDAKFLQDLDGGGLDAQLACNAAGVIYGGHLWTGTKCCSELGDIDEYYNDPGDGNQTGIGACWDSTPFQNGNIVDVFGNHNRTVPILGEWQGCNLAGDAQGQALLAAHPGLINDNNPCDAYPDAGMGLPGAVCSINNNQWHQVVEAGDHVEKFAEIEMQGDGSYPSECCAENSCWNGYACVANQRYDSIFGDDHSGYRCIDGTWMQQTPKNTWSRQNLGYCSEATQCLVLPGGSSSTDASDYVPGTQPSIPGAGSPSCVDDQGYILQYKCEGGEWSSRTLDIALALNDFALSGAGVSDYTIYCDNWDNVLNFVDYKALDNAAQVSEYVTKSCPQNGGGMPCVNQFCALTYTAGGSEQVAIGVSLNSDVSDESKSILPAFGYSETTCDGEKNSNNAFDECTEDLWYNHDLNSIIVTPEGENLGGATTAALRAAHQATFEAPMADIAGFSSTAPHIQHRTSFFSESSIFDHVYVAKRGAKDYFGYMGIRQFNGTPLHYVGIRHENFDVQDTDGKSPCDMIESSQAGGKHTGVIDFEQDCQFVGDNFDYLGYATGTTSKRSTIGAFFLDLTAKLRP